MLPGCGRPFVNDKPGRIAETEIANLNHLRTSQRTEELVCELMNDHTLERQPCDNESRYHKKRRLKIWLETSATRMAFARDIEAAFSFKGNKPIRSSQRDGN